MCILVNMSQCSATDLEPSNHEEHVVPLASTWSRRSFGGCVCLFGTDELRWQVATMLLATGNDVRVGDADLHSYSLSKTLPRNRYIES